MRTLAIAALCLLASALVRADTGFDHNLHDRDVAVSGAEAIGCASCHATKNGLLVGRPDHASCFGACHGGAPKRPRAGAAIEFAPEQKRVCESCHPAAALAAPMGKTLAVPFPPYKATDFALTMSHKLHGDVACTACHFLAAKPAPHKRCAGCHDGAKAPLMTKCTTCHGPGSGNPLPPKLREPIDTVTSEFSHPKHAARGGLGAQCITCHAEVRQSDDSILPRPTQQACAVAGCHDGKPTFATTTACTRCHTAPPPWKFDVERPTDRFSHSTTHKDVKLACITCHPLGPTGEVLVSGHGPCVACHADRFGERRRPTDEADPKRPKQICGACHNATEPWRKLTADRPPPERTEFGATLAHSLHGADCKSCHSLATATAQLRPPRGHRACTGGACHAVKGGPTPELTACESCHELGLAAKRLAVRSTLPWSTRATFDHAPHRVAKDGTEIACTTCHVDLSAPSLIQLAAPAKATCAPCHDGTTAFKLTGTTCTRCHPGAKR